ncbi:MAG: DUF302 domain-containing protein, partial [Anaerolineales bacterium]|nr:DUF302 domain-containing protein [Anaerolineales bacterium]
FFYSVNLDCSYQQALEKVTEALKTEGFGVLTKIDVKTTLKEKIGEDFRHYAILGACNPPLAHKALENNSMLGLVLPCNVTVEESKQGAIVNLINPNTMLLSIPGFEQNQTLKEVASEATKRFKRVADALRSG